MLDLAFRIFGSVLWVTALVTTIVMQPLQEFQGVDLVLAYVGLSLVFATTLVSIWIGRFLRKG